VGDYVYLAAMLCVACAVGRAVVASNMCVCCGCGGRDYRRSLCGGVLKQCLHGVVHEDMAARGHMVYTCGCVLRLWDVRGTYMAFSH
jgi:hypothetical protein